MRTLSAPEEYVSLFVVHAERLNAKKVIGYCYDVSKGGSMSLIRFSVAVAILMSLTQQVHAVGNTDLGNGFVNVTLPPYSATPTTTGTCSISNDATAAIQNAINDVAAGGGGTVYLPTGAYCVLSHLEIKGYVTLKGVFNAPPTSYPITTGIPKGTTLLAYENKNNALGTAFITVTAGGAGIDGIAIHYPEQILPTGPGWTPVHYPYTIRVPWHDAQIKNVFLHNSFLGINLDGAGRHILKGIYGQPIQLGLHVDNIYDVGRISDVHFWPFWTENPHVMRWIQDNGHGMNFLRSDWQMGENIFTYGYRMGMTFGTSDAGATNGTFTNIGHDGAQFGVVVYETQSPGLLFTNLNIALTSPNQSYGIANFSPLGKSSELNVINGSIWGNPTYSVYWGGDGLLTMSGVRINHITPGIPAIEVTKGDVMITGNSFKTPAATGIAVRVGTGAGKALVGGNMLYGKTIQNLGAATTLTPNSP